MKLKHQWLREGNKAQLEANNSFELFQGILDQVRQNEQSKPFVKRILKEIPLEERVYFSTDLKESSSQVRLEVQEW